MGERCGVYGREWMGEGGGFIEWEKVAEKGEWVVGSGEWMGDGCGDIEWGRGADCVVMSG